MSDEWDFYFAKVNDAPASLFVDLGIRESVPDPDRPCLLWTWVYFRQPRPDGLSSSEEMPGFFEVEDTLTSAVRTATDGELVGRITTSGRREFYFYAPREDRFEDAVGTALGRFPLYRFDCGSQEDREWSHYLNVLYPTPRNHERIKNRRTVEMLEKEGDRLRKPRPVRHWSYFRSLTDREVFVAKSTCAGFTVVDESEDTDRDAEYRYGVTVERTDAVDWDTINEVSLLLFGLTEEHGGDYDGWETEIQRDG